MKHLLLCLALFAALFSARAQGNSPIQQIGQNVVYRINGATQLLIIGRDTVIRPKDSLYAFITLKKVGDSVNLYAFDYTVSKFWKKISGNTGGSGPGGTVSSVFGRTGDVAPMEGDYDEYYPLLSAAYQNPDFIASLTWSKITGAPPFLTTEADPLSIKILDSSTMLNNYRHWAAGYLKAPDIAGKLNISDTGAMLLPYLRKTGFTPNRVFYTNAAGQLTVSDDITFDGDNLSFGISDFSGQSTLSMASGKGGMTVSGWGMQMNLGSTNPYDPSKSFRVFNGSTEYFRLGSIDDGLQGNHYARLYPGVDLIMDRFIGTGDRYTGVDATGKFKIMPTPSSGNPNMNLQQVLTNGYTVTGPTIVQHIGGGEYVRRSGDSTRAGEYSEIATDNALVRIIQQQANGNDYAKLSMASGMATIEAYKIAASSRWNFLNNGVLQRQTFPGPILDTMATQAWVRANAGSGSGNFNATINSPSTGQMIRYNGTSWVNSAIQAADVPVLNQNTTGTASNITATSNSTLTTLGSLSLPFTQTTGTVPLNRGGTGATDAATARANLATGQVTPGNINRMAIYAADGSTISNHGPLVGGRVMTTDGNGLPNYATTTYTEVNYVSGVTSAIQPQLNSKLTAASNLSDLSSAPTARTNLGLGNVDNTSDLSKPISTATLTALNTLIKSLNPLPDSSGLEVVWYNNTKDTFGLSISKDSILAALPTQTGQAGKVLSTNGSALSWITPSAGNSFDPSQPYTWTGLQTFTTNPVIQGATARLSINNASGSERGAIYTDNIGANGGTFLMLANTTNGSFRAHLGARSQSGQYKFLLPSVGSDHTIPVQVRINSVTYGASDAGVIDLGTISAATPSLQAVTTVGNETTTAVISNSSLDVRLPAAGVPHARLGFVSSADLSATGGMLTIKSNKNGESSAQGNLTFGGTTNAFFDLIPGNAGGTDTVATYKDIRFLSSAGSSSSYSGMPEFNEQFVTFNGNALSHINLTSNTAVGNAGAGPSYNTATALGRRQNKTRYTTAATTAGTTISFRPGGGNFILGNGTNGGFDYTVRFGFGSVVADELVFIGLNETNANLAATTNPSALNNGTIGISKDAADVNLHIIHGDGYGTPLTKVDTGIPFTAGDNYLYTLKIASTTAGVHTVSLSVMGATNTTYDYTIPSNAPARARELRIHNFLSNNTSTGNIHLDMVQLYNRAPIN